MSRPIWGPHLAGLLIRIPLGLYFLLAGRMKLQNIENFVETVKKFGVLPQQAATLYGVLFPYFEILTGALLLLGIFTTLAALFGAVILLSFSMVFSLGLFPNGPWLLNKDLVLIGAVLALLSTGAGYLSVDKFRVSG